MKEPTVEEIKHPAYTGEEFQDEDTIKIMLCEPNNGYIHSTCHDNRLDFYMQCKEFQHRSNGKYRFFTLNTHRMIIAFAREMLCEQAVKANMDYVLFIDDDMTVPMDMVERLLEHDADIVAPLAVCRRWPFEPVTYNLKVGDKNENGDRVMYSEPKLDWEQGDVFECDAVGFGVVLLKVETLRKIDKPWFFTSQAVGEDILFCFKARDQLKDDFRILIDTNILVGHLAEPEVKTYWDFHKLKDTELYQNFKKDHHGKSKGVGNG